MLQADLRIGIYPDDTVAMFIHYERRGTFHEDLSCYRRRRFIGSNFVLYLLDKYKDDIQVINVDALNLCRKILRI